MKFAHKHKGTVSTAAIVCSLLAMPLLGPAVAATSQAHYATAQDAVTALVAALRNDDMKTLESALGPEGNGILYSGDPVEDNAARDRFVAAFDQKSTLVTESPTKVALDIGNDAWPFPIPLVKDASGWRFDTATGRQELINRRIGRDELSVIQVCLAYVDAQREYATFDHSGNGILKYAQRFKSTEGKQDGLYWPTKEGEPPSPVGELMVAAQAKGKPVPSLQPEAGPTPYYGYYFKILTAQGPNATRGARDYIVNGNMIGGFAMVAYPATYGNSGIMTFIVNQDGSVFAKDLGERSKAIASAMTKFDPDKTWIKQDTTPPPTN